MNFDEEDQRKRYIVNCLEQIAEASKEIDLLTGEYTLVTSYLTDTDEIEALPAEQREEVNRVAGKLAGLEQERSRYREKKNRMRDADFYAIRKRENEIEEGIQKIRDGEKYGNLIRQDLHRLDGERHAYEYRRNELENLMNNQRGMAVIFLTALIVCVIMLVILQYVLKWMSMWDFSGSRCRSCSHLLCLHPVHGCRTGTAAGGEDHQQDHPAAE